jgi:hypothetical protein
MKKKLLIILGVIVLLLGFSKQSKASHYAGAELTYSCLGGNDYLLTLVFYRDCSGVSAPAYALIDFKHSVINSSCGNFRDTLLLISGPVEVTPVCSTAATTCNGGTLFGLEKYVYQGQVTLPPCNDWIISWNNCCRNPSNTLLNATSQEWTLPANLNNFDAPCNSSPYFSNLPATIICTGQNYCYNNTASDPDGDSLVYALVTPYQGSITFPYYGSCTYQGGYNALNPLPSNPPISIDNLTGQIYMAPTQSFSAVIAVVVEEWRRINGVPTKIGFITRDMQFNVIAFTNYMPTIAGINPSATQYSINDSTYAIMAHPGDTLDFNIYPFDQDTSQNLTLTYNSNITNSVWTDTNNNSPNAVGHFHWIAQLGENCNIPQCFTVSVGDNNCPYNGQQTFSYFITVKGSEIAFNPQPDTLLCLGDSYQIIALADSHVVNYYWIVDGNLVTPTINDSTFLIDATTLGFGVHTITCLVDNGVDTICPGKTSVKVTVYSCASINEVSNKRSWIDVFPNPANDILFIQGLKNSTTVEINNIKGALVQSEKLLKDNIDIHTLAPGLYFIKLYTEQGSVVRKFVKE